jgi:hypothetical protein
MKIDRLFIAAGIVILMVALNAAFAGPPHGYGGNNVTIGGPTTVRNDVHPTAISGAFSASQGGDGGAGGAGGVGGAGGIGQGGSVSAPISTTSSTSVNTRAYGGGSTGLTGNARCLQSFGFAFNAISATYTDKNCLAMEVAEEHCADKECKKRVACANPDVPSYAKKSIGCPDQ